MTSQVSAHTEAKPPKPKATSSISSSRQRRSQQSHNSQLDDESKRLKSLYSSSLSALQEMFPDWKEEDLLSLLSETEGNVNVAAEQIFEGKFFF